MAVRSKVRLQTNRDPTQITRVGGMFFSSGLAIPLGEGYSATLQPGDLCHHLSSLGHHTHEFRPKGWGQSAQTVLCFKAPRAGRKETSPAKFYSTGGGGGRGQDGGRGMAGVR